MEIKILGTGAAEAIPAIWCECETCAKAQKLGGKDLRRRCCYLLDDDTLVDFGPDAFWQVSEFGIDLRKIKRIIFTHRHSDHLNPLELLWRRKGFSTVARNINIFGSPQVFNRIVMKAADEGMTYDLKDLLLTPNILRAGEPVQDDGFGILPLPANHDPGGSPFFYILSRNERKILIGNDTGYPPEEAWALMADQKADVALLDCTTGLSSPDCANGHMGVNTVVKVRDRLLECGAIKADTRVYANHFSHNGHALHADLETFFTPKGIGVTYDGLILDI